MTREEAIEYLKWMRPKKPWSLDKKNTQIAIDKAIKALEQQTCDDCVSRNAISRTLNTMDRYVADELTLCDTDEKFPKNEVFILDEVYEHIVEQLPSVSPQQTRWIPASERLPEESGWYLITLENGDICQCEFNPDYWDEDNNRAGAFTYYHQYFDPATLGMIDEEEIAVDAIAWMPFEPYVPDRKMVESEVSDADLD